MNRRADRCRDPLAVDLRDRATGPDAVRNILALSQVFAPSLAADPGFVTPSPKPLTACALRVRAAPLPNRGDPNMEQTWRWFGPADAIN